MLLGSALPPAPRPALAVPRSGKRRPRASRLHRGAPPLPCGTSSRGTLPRHPGRRRTAGELFPTLSAPCPLPHPAAVSVRPRVDLAPRPCCLGRCRPPPSSGGSSPEKLSRRREEGRSSLTPLAPGGGGGAGPQQAPLSARPPNSRSYWPEVSAPSGTPASHWPVPVTWSRLPPSLPPSGDWKPRAAATGPGGSQGAVR